MVGFDISNFEPSSSATTVLVKGYGLPYGISISHVLLYNFCLIMYVHRRTLKLFLPPLILLSCLTWQYLIQ
jgi:hypothetical protein